MSGEILARPVFASGSSKPFGELTRQEVRERAVELRQATGWGPMARVGPVALAWGELARAMEAAGAERVDQLDAAEIARRADALWVVMP